MPNANAISFNVGFIDSGGPVEVWNFDIMLTESTTEKDLKGLVEAQVLARSVDQSHGITAEDIVYAAPSFLSAIPGAAITDAPADAVTNYNVLTTLLGTLTGAVNEANAKQNDIAEKLNTLLAHLRTAGIIAA